MRVASLIDIEGVAQNDPDLMTFLILSLGLSMYRRRSLAVTNPRR